MMKKILLLLVAMLMALPFNVFARQTVYGDVNGDLEVNIADVNSVIDVILNGNAVTAAADVNNDGEINIADVNAVIDIILGGGIDPQLLKVCEKVVEIDEVVADYYMQCESIEELMQYAEDIEALDGVEYIFSNDNSTLYVAIKDFGTISYSYYPKVESNDDYNAVSIALTKANIGETHDHLINQGDSKVLIAFQMSKDDDWYKSGLYLNALSDHFGYAGIDSEVRTTLDVEFFRNGIFDCDYLCLLTHGGYEFDENEYNDDNIYRGLHWLLTTEEISKNALIITLAKMRIKYDKQDVSYDHVKEIRNGKTVDVMYKKVSDHFIESSNKSFNHPGKGIVFNSACHSMQGPGIKVYEGDSINYHFATVFEQKGAGVYLGYDEENTHGDEGAMQFYCNLISGMSLMNAYNNLQFQILHDYKIKDSRTWWADLVQHYIADDFLNNCIVCPSIVYNDESTENELKVNLHAIIHAASFYSQFEYAYNENDGWVESSVSGFDYIESLKYGFELSESEQFSNAILLGEKSVHDDGCEFDESGFELDFSQILTDNSSQADSQIRPNTTYWVRAYVYDGQGYNYSEPITFTTGSVSGGTQEHEWVDLGLPSGTLWATCNVGANSPEEYGDYFAWGETEPKDYYDWSNYKWCNGSYTTMTKYCTKSKYGYNGFVDNKSELDPEDDAAYVNWGPSWRMPTIEQLHELVENCTVQWKPQNGVMLPLLTGPNGNTLFLPAAGRRWGDSFGGAGSLCYYWSRTLISSDPYRSYYLELSMYGLRWYYSFDRYNGFTVRPVRASRN